MGDSQGQTMGAATDLQYGPEQGPNWHSRQHRERAQWGIVTHLHGLHDGLIQVREAREPEHHAVDQLRQLLQAAGPRVGVLLEQRGHHGGDVREELWEQSGVRLRTCFPPETRVLAAAQHTQSSLRREACPPDSDPPPPTRGSELCRQETLLTGSVALDTLPQSLPR